MPLPRFQRLPEDEQRRILDIALRSFATDGVDAASYNQIIAKAGISRSSAYNYFDGRDDLLGAVLNEVAESFSATLGPWPPAADAEEFWAALEASAERMSGHIEQHPEHLSLIDAAFIDRTRGRFTGWIEEVVDNGRELGVITIAVDHSLIVAVTSAVLPAFDTWAAEEIRSGKTPEFGTLRTILGHLWGSDH